MAPTRAASARRTLPGVTPQPDPYADAFSAPIVGRAVAAGVMLGLFDALAEEETDAATLAERLELDALGAETLVTALSSLGYLEQHRGRLRNAPVSRRLLVRSSPESIATFAGEQADLHWQAMTLLPEAVRSGARYAFHEQRGDPELWRAYIRGLFEITRPEQDANSARVPLDEPRLLVDVAGGHGGFSIAMCRRHPSLRAIVCDLEPSVAVGREIVAEQGFGERISFRVGDVFAAGLPGDADVVSVFNLVHHLPDGRNRELMRLARAALKPGGTLVVGDSERPVPGEPVSQQGAVSSLLFYAWSHSRNFSRAELAGWLEAAGFEDVRVERNERSPWRILVLGRAPR
jgi:SAM-dependent methyltransferase